MGSYTTVFSSAMPLMEENPNEMRDTILSAVLQGAPIAESITDTLMGGMGIKVNSARVWAKNNYVLGLPSEQVATTGPVDDTVVAAAITDSLGLEFGCIALANDILITTAEALVMPYLYSTRGYNAIDSTIDVLPSGWLLELYDINVTKIGAFSTTMKVSNILFSTGSDPDVLYITIEYTAVVTYPAYRNEEGEVIVATLDPSSYTSTFTETVPSRTGIRPDTLYYIAAYKRKIDVAGNTSDTIDWWYYDLNTNRYPELIPSVDSIEENNSYPVVPIRFDNQFLNESVEPEDIEIYETGSKYLKRVGVGFDHIVSLMESSEDLDEMDNAYVMFGANLQSDNSVVLCYLAEFFTYLSELNPVSIWDRLAGLHPDADTGKDSTNTYTSGSTIELQEYMQNQYDEYVNTVVINSGLDLSLNEYGLKTDIKYNYITSVISNGFVCEVGTAIKEIEEIAEERLEIEGGSDAGEETLITTKSSILTIKQQLTPNTYRTVSVKGLVHINNVYKRWAVFTTPLDLLEDPENSNFIIPLNYTVVSRLKLLDRNRLYEQSFMLVINAIVKTETPWYQSGFFKVIIVIIAVVITFFTQQPWVLGLVEAAKGGIAVLLMYILPALIKSLVLGVVLKYVAKQLGPKWTFVVAIIAVLVSKGQSFLAITKATAENLLTVGMAGLKAAGQSYTDLIDKVVDEYEDWLIESEEQLQELADARDLLTPETLLPLSLLTSSYEYPEPDMKTQPEVFYDSVHIGNVGTISLDVIENYVDVTLLLPQAKDNEY